MNEEIKLNARRAMAGQKRYFALCAVLPGVVLFFSCTVGAGAEMLLRVKTVRSFLASLHPAVPDVLGAVLLILTLLVFTVLFSAVSQSGFCRFTDEALCRKTDRSRWFHLPLLKESIKLNCLSFAIRLGLFLLFSALPAAVTLLCALYAAKNPVPPGTVIPAAVGCGALILTALFFYTLAAGSLVCAPYLLAGSPEIGGTRAVKESLKKTRGSLGEIMLFRLSFLPWFLFCAAGLPVFFVLPYYRQSMACFIFTE